MNLVPTYDLLGSPSPFWLVQLLMALTLALHWAFLGATVGGTVVVLLNALRKQSEASRALTPFLPFFLSMAMTLGVAPLLFVQVLYGQFFYTSNILLGYWWLGLLVLVIANFYLFWWAWHRLEQGKGLSWLVPAVVLVVFVKSALILSSNATLTQSPDAWAAVWAKGMNRLYAGAPSLVPRLLFALSGLVASGGLVVAILSRAGLLYQGDAAAKGQATGLSIALPALVVQLVSGIALLIFLPGVQRSAVLAGGFEAVFGYLAILAFLGAAALTWLARGADALGKVVLPGLAYFVALFMAAFARDTARRAAIAPHFKLSTVPVHPEWLNLGLFLVIFVAGLGVIAYLIKLARTPAAASA